MNKKWFVIVNPTSGNGASIKKWPLIFNELKQQQFNFEFVITTHKYHAENLVQNAIIKGFKKFICIGGDGTLHAIVNGILSLNTENRIHYYDLKRDLIKSLNCKDAKAHLELQILGLTKCKTD